MIKRYAIIENEKVVNVTISEESLKPTWIQSDTAKKGDDYNPNSGVFTTPPPEPPPEEVDTVLNSDLDFNGKTANKIGFRQIADTSRSSGTHTFNYVDGDAQQLTAAGNITIALSGFPSGDVAVFIADAVNWGNYTITLPAHKSNGGEALAFTSSGTDRVRFYNDKDDVLTITVVDVDIS